MATVTSWGSLWGVLPLPPCLFGICPDLGLSCTQQGPELLCPDLTLFPPSPPLPGPGRGGWSSLAFLRVLSGQDRVLGPWAVSLPWCIFRADPRGPVLGDPRTPRAEHTGDAEGWAGRLQLAGPDWPLHSGCAPAGPRTPATPSSGWTVPSAPSSSTSVKSSGSVPRCPGGTRRPPRWPTNPSPKSR